MAASNGVGTLSSGERMPLMRLEGVHVSFGGTVALVDEEFQILPGEVVGLLGHNGAGKSTLVNVATGAVRPQRGTMSLRGKQVPLRGHPRDMERLGIKVIHQVPALADNLPIYDNITLGRPEERWSRAKRRRIARDALGLLGSNINVDRPVSSLEFGEKQIVDLARALSTNVTVLLLDEPTGALGQHETDNLHALLRRLAAERHGIVYVSHRLRDILEICTRLVVMRSGRVVLDRAARGIDVTELSEALAPGTSSRKPQRAGAAVAEPVLDVVWRGQHVGFGRGEIVGLFGMAAGPQFKLLRALFGVGDDMSGTLQGSRFIPRSPREAIQAGVYYVSADRERDGLLPQMSALDNLVLPWLEMHRSFLAFSHSKAAGIYERARAALNIRGAHMDAPAGALSGGNRQKLVVGRWLFGQRPRVLLLSQPTQGVDVGARLDIAGALRALADEGVTVIVASSETDEIALLCDRALICEGETWEESPKSEAWEERLLKGLISRADV